ncbi:hypothetical protein THRCLA_02688 [Thraustotheca clavata]|uniref:Uncharacterized protein n=1 Tax=Thraustotheca clavata TaxID=74557 RepID=A0A1W0A4F9_9STRA|nr:hypothetical protein THRCLA_02688 [Thraustotheca clavata]
MAETLFGIDNNEIGTFEYDAMTIRRYIRMNIKNEQRQQKEVLLMASTGHRVMYMESDAENNEENALQFGNCSVHQNSDRIYTEDYILPMLQRILISINSPIDLFAAPITHLVLIDCSHTGRRFHDTSFIYGGQLTTITSFALQTKVAERSVTHMQTQVGPVIISTAKFKWFYETWKRTQQDIFTSTVPSVYQSAVSFYFPY